MPEHHQSLSLVAFAPQVSINSLFKPGHQRYRSALVLEVFFWFFFFLYCWFFFYFIYFLQQNKFNLLKFASNLQKSCIVHGLGYSLGCPQHLQRQKVIIIKLLGYAQTLVWSLLSSYQTKVTWFYMPLPNRNWAYASV